MKTIPQTFSRNKIDYHLIERVDDVALFKLFLEGDHVGWEVSIIYHNEARTIAGKQLEESESLTSETGFGGDGSKSFFPEEENNAIVYFIKLAEAERLKKLENSGSVR